MKKFVLLSMLTLISSVTALSVAYAAPSDCFDGGSGFDCTLLSSTLLPMMTSSMGEYDKDAYIAQIHDAAADFIASDGQEAASAVLKEAIERIRLNDPSVQTLTDLQISQVLMGQTASP